MELIESHVIASMDTSLRVAPADLCRLPQGGVAWIADGCLTAIHVTPGGVVETTMVVPDVVQRMRVADITGDRSRVLLLTDDELVEIDAGGALRWRLPFPPKGVNSWLGRPSASYGGTTDRVWLYRPDAASGRDDQDLIVLIDAELGEELATERIATAGHGADLRCHSDGSVLMDVGEGQDGVTVHRLFVEDGCIRAHDFGWDDRCLIGVSPDGSTFLTVEHQQSDVIIHRYPDGEVITMISVDDVVEAVGIERDDDTDDVWFDWRGGFLDDRTIVLHVVNLVDECEQAAAFLLDTEAYGVLGFVSDSVEALGDGTWIERDSDGRLVRRALA